MKLLPLYLLIINIITFLLYGIDKWKAKHQKWRIRESVLIGAAILGGSVGGLLGMYMFRHKTKHIKFTVGLPIILIIQIIVLIVV